jgi:hypothetical protein
MLGEGLTTPHRENLACYEMLYKPKREELAGGWRRLHNEELRNVYASPSIIRVIKSKRMRFAGHVTRIVQVRNACNTLVGNPEGM